MPNTRNRKSQRKSNRRQNKKSQRKSNRRQNRKSLRKSNKKQTRQLRNKLGGNESNQEKDILNKIKEILNINESLLDFLKKNNKLLNEIYSEIKILINEEIELKKNEDELCLGNPTLCNELLEKINDKKKTIKKKIENEYLKNLITEIDIDEKIKKIEKYRNENENEELYNSFNDNILKLIEEIEIDEEKKNKIKYNFSNINVKFDMDIKIYKKKEDEIKNLYFTDEKYKKLNMKNINILIKKINNQLDKNNYEEIRVHLSEFIKNGIELSLIYDTDPNNDVIVAQNLINKINNTNK